jgi:hypothetical protein
MLIERQLNHILAQNAVTDIVDAKVMLWMSRDIEPRNKVKIGPGLMSQGTVSITSSQTVTIPLPPYYALTQRLAFYLMTTSPIKVTVTTSPSIGSQDIYVYGTNSTAEGSHLGHLSFQEIGVSSIAIKNLVGANTAEINWLAWQMPNLALPSSWKDGNQTTGTV